MESKEIVQNLKKRLPRGYTRKIANEMGCTIQNVSQAINSGKISSPIWDRAMKLADAHQKKINKVATSLES